MDIIVWNLKHINLNGTKLAWVANQQRSSQDVRPSNLLNILATDCCSVVSCKSSLILLLLLLQLASYCLHPSALCYLAEKAVASVSVRFHGCNCGNDLSIKGAGKKQQKVSQNGSGIKTCKNRDIEISSKNTKLCQKDPESGLKGCQLQSLFDFEIFATSLASHQS